MGSEYEPSLAQLDVDRLFASTHAHLHTSRGWPIRAERDDVTVRSGFLPGLPWRAYRTDLELRATVEQVTRFVADEMFEWLGRWNREFIAGTVHRVLEDRPDRKSWFMQVWYRTPPVMKNRDYLYFLGRRRDADGAVTIAYQSVNEPCESPFGVRGLLHETVHRVVPIAGDRVRLEHVLSGDVRGAIPLRLQNTLLSSGFVAANLRDGLAQKELFAQGVPQRAAPSLALEG
ncbi:MAG: START domain-containing protein [Myxococcota bacterium]